MKMNKRYIIILLFLTASVSFLIIRCLHAHKRNKIYSTISSITAAIITENRNKNSTLKDIFSSSTKEEQFLNSEEYDRVIFEIDRLHKLDIPKNQRSQFRLVDFWGNRYMIAYRELPNQELDVVVVSKGRDGIYGTADDISSPGTSAPPILDGH
jgi:hypothetical protein